jgi:dipeptide/tripeptide permease
MRAILPLFMTAQLMMEDTQASKWYSCFKMGCYFLPLFGGYLADKFLGRYWTIIGFSVPYVVGQLFILGETQTTLIIALVLCEYGSGVIKPKMRTLITTGS